MTTPSNVSKKGFTLVELNLAIVFVAILLLAVAMTTIYVTRLYQHGVTLKTVNQVGREVVDQVRRDVAAANPQKVEFVTDADDVWRLCLGSVSYVANSAVELEASSLGLATDNSLNPFQLMRIDDATKSWCAGGGSKKAMTSGESATELLAGDVIPLAVHNMTVSTLASAELTNSSVGLMSISIDLGTNEAGTTIGGVCKPPTDLDSNFDKCVVRRFETAIRMVGV